MTGSKKWGVCMREPCQPDHVALTFPADERYMLVARMTLSGMGALMGLDVDLVGDLRTASDECCDCLLHQGTTLTGIAMEARCCKQNRLHVSYRALWGDEPDPCEPLDMDVTRGILETLMPEVSILSDAHGVSEIRFSMPL